MIKNTLLYFCLIILSQVNAQNKNSNLIEKKIESCRISINDSMSIYKIHENFKTDFIDIIIKTENTITPKCDKEVITSDIEKAINNSQNPIVKINGKYVKDLNITDFKNLIPSKISVLQKKKYKILIIEIESFSYSTAGSGYIELYFKIDSKGIVTDKKILESKLPMKIIDRF